MSQRDEQISALVDNALDNKELNGVMQDLKRDQIEDAERMQRYQLIGDAVRNELDQTSFMDISAAVHRAIEQEPGQNTQHVDSPRRFNLAAWMRPLTGMAIAASVALVTVVSVRIVSTESGHPNQQSPIQQLAIQQLADPQPSTSKIAPNPIIPANREVANSVRVASTQAPQAPSQLEQKQLRDYMMKHSGYAGQTTMQGMMPYARVVSFDSKTRH